MKTGLFIGSFNPPTNAHFAIGHYLYENKILDKIVYVPVDSNKKDLVSLDKRISMLKYYTKRFHYLTCSDIMLNNKKKFNYLIINELKKEYANLFIIIGSDILNKLKDFEHIEELLEKYQFIVVPRFDIEPKKIIEERFFQYASRFQIINFQSNISSSLVRESLFKNENIDKIVPQEILNYIKRQELYK